MHLHSALVMRTGIDSMALRLVGGRGGVRSPGGVGGDALTLVRAAFLSSSTADSIHGSRLSVRIALASSHSSDVCSWMAFPRLIGAFAPGMLYMARAFSPMSVAKSTSCATRRDGSVDALLVGSKSSSSSCVECAGVRIARVGNRRAPRAFPPLAPSSSPAR